MGKSVFVATDIFKTDAICYHNHTARPVLIFFSKIKANAPDCWRKIGYNHDCDDCDGSNDCSVHLTEADCKAAPYSGCQWNPAVSVHLIDKVQPEAKLEKT